MKKQMKPLQDLTLLDRFLFSEAVEDPEFLEDVLSIIMGEEVLLKNLPQTEKEIRSRELRKYIRLDVWAEDEENTVYDTEVQQDNTGNLPKRSRYYQAMTDSKLLEIGDTAYENLNRVHMIMIAPFDLFGRNRYMYTFQMRCVEEPDLSLNDDAFRIFLNTKGNDDEHISPELKSMLQFFENPSEEVASDSDSERIRRMQKRVKTLKANEEMGVKYMREWEEKALERQEGRKEGEARINELIKLLVAAGRIDDLTKAAEDKEFQEELLKEFGL